MIAQENHSISLDIGILQMQSQDTHVDQAQDRLYKVRHSLAHVLAQAVLSIRPGSTLGFGPPIADGFYYDFILTQPLNEEDFPVIETKMRELINHKEVKFEREELEYDAAMTRLDGMNEPYKKQYAQELFDKKGISKLTFYRSGTFLDMCDGPHVEKMRDLPKNIFKIKSIAGAYWRGDSKNVMMTRIYVWAFETEEELNTHVKNFYEAQARDHKKIGKDLEIFTIDETVGKGLPLWLPAGTVLRDEIEKLAKELEFKAGYHRVATPHLTKAELYYQTGHLPYYKEHMYPMMEIKETNDDGEQIKEVYCLKPMNCPHHHKIFSHRMRSYKELPLRLAEYGQVYRFEDSGALSGLLRVRGMCMNDAHIYCTEENLKAEFLAVMDMHKEVYRVLGLKDYYMRFSTWDPEDPKGQQKYVNDPEAWEKSQNFIREAMIESGLPFKEVKGEAAFYGPKIDVQFKTVTGREETASTNQLDFAVPARLDLKYVGPDGQEHRPYIIHRAPLGTHERFIAFLIEHYAGAFPTWLAPVQVKILTVSEKFIEYAQKLVSTLRNDMIRVELDDSSERIPKKIRNAVTSKTPNVIVIGEKEVAEGTVTLRKRGVEQQETVKVDVFIERLQRTIKTRSVEFLD
jgi:threonyl-tRNA synthetase